MRTLREGEPGEMYVQWSFVDRLIAMLLGIVHFALGLAILYGGPSRFPPPSYTNLLALTNGAVWPYALAWGGGGLIMICSPWVWIRLGGIGVVVIISNLWAALFAVAAFHSSTAALTPSVAYGGYGLLNSALWVLTFIHARRALKES